MEIKVPFGEEYRPPNTFLSKNLTWREYETYVFGTMERLLPHANVAKDVRVKGIKTGRMRQIDILVTRDLGGFELKIALDCKSYGRKVNVNDVERFLGMLGDIRVSKGVLVTTQGYTKTAWNRAQNESRDMELHILTVEQLSRFHGMGCAVLWKEPIGALVSPPDGWVVDNERRPIVPGSESPVDTPPFTLYPLGHTRDSAIFSGAFIYGSIMLKSPELPTMEAIANSHERRVLEECPTARFDRLAIVEWRSKARYQQEETILRVGHIHAGYKGPEYSLYIDHPEGVLLLVLFCPEGKDNSYLPLLKWVGENVLIMDMVDKRGTGSSSVHVSTELPR